jgi:hypothetical protein
VKECKLVDLQQSCKDFFSKKEKFVYNTQIHKFTLHSQFLELDILSYFKTRKNFIQEVSLILKTWICNMAAKNYLS